MSNQSLDSVYQNPSDPSKVMRYLLNDKTNTQHINQSQRLSKPVLLHELSNAQLMQQQVSRSRSFLELEKTFPNIQYTQENLKMPLDINVDISKSVDLAGVMSPKSLIQSCLTFKGNEIEDINFLSQALQPDKIFDLPLAMIKVQKAFQQSNKNAMKLKESLELVLQRENQLQQKHDKLKKEKTQQLHHYEEDLIRQKQILKDQLKQFTQSIQTLQNQVSERDMALEKLKDQLSQLYRENQELRGLLELKSDKQTGLAEQKEMLQEQLQRKQRDIEELRQQFEMLRRAEDESSKEIQKINNRSSKDIRLLKSQVEEKSLIIDVLQKDIECARQEKRLAQDQQEKLMGEIHRMRSNFKDDIEKKYVDLLEYKKNKEKELEEYRTQINGYNNKSFEIQKKYEKSQQNQQKTEDELLRFKKEIACLNENNREALNKQRESYERKLKEMEDEVTQMSLGRYKNELEQKQKFLKLTKRYDDQMTDLRSALGYILGRTGIQNIPEYMQGELTQTISETRVSKDLQKTLYEFDAKINAMIEHNHQKKVDLGLQNQYEQLLKAYKSELMMRRGLHNQLQELKGNIRVLCRVRPLLNHEYKGRKKGTQALRLINQHLISVENESGTKEQKFEFDRVFEPEISQNEIQEEVQQLVLSCLDGFNVCIMAYGQTGSGKTYTMIGTDENPGLYFSSVEELFDQINDRKKIINYEVSVSFVEIYNEHLRDLLSKKGQQAGQIIKIRENVNGETVTDQIMKPVKSKNQVLQCLKEACTNRTVGVTHYNEQSSRSHFVFTIHVTGRHKDTKQVFEGRLNLIDLAGSERILKSQAEGDRIKEALNINQSLTTLGKVFLSLLNKAPHVPYRDSKLTHYLKDSLGGESKTMLIVQVSPSMNDYGETLSSLNFGQRVACIEKGMIRATIESPNRVPSNLTNKRSKSSNQRSFAEIDVKAGSATPKNIYRSPRRML